MRICIVILCFLAKSFLTFAATIHVPGDFSSIQAALNDCSTNDTILVQPGIYFENIIWPNKAGIKLFAEGDSTNTVIDGGHLGRVLTFSQENIDTLTIVRGFQITNGYLQGTSLAGAGIYLNECGVKLEEINVSGNHLFSESDAYGAGLYSRKSNLVFRRSSVQYNYIDSSDLAKGAGIFVENADFVYLDNLKIVFNRIEFSGSTGAVFIESVLNVQVNDCKIIHNSIGTGHDGFKGAITIVGSYVSIDDLVVDSNICEIAGTWNEGAGIYFEYSQITAFNLKVSHNMTGDSGTWYHGGGIYIYESEVNLVNLIVTDNIWGDEGSWYNGAGVFATQSNLTITNGLIVNNLMGLGGTWYDGGGIYIGNGTNDLFYFDLINVTVANNRRADNGIIYGSGIYTAEDIHFDCFNSILWNLNDEAEILTYANPVHVTYSDIRNGFTGSGNINADPLFVSNTDFHLTPSSSCLGAGQLNNAPTFDLEGSLRPLPSNTNPDLGCYEMDLPVTVDLDAFTNQIIISPNPATNYIIIEIVHAIRSVEIFDALGRMVSREEINSNQDQVEISYLPPGFYLAKIQGQNNSWLGKFVKL